MAPRQFEPLDIEKTLAGLSLLEKSKLLAGSGPVSGVTTWPCSNPMVLIAVAHVCHRASGDTSTESEILYWWQEFLRFTQVSL